MSEEEKLKLLLFMVVRNNSILPVGARLNKSQEEITIMTKKTIEELFKMIDFDEAKKIYNLDKGEIIID